MFGIRHLGLTPAEFYSLTVSDYWWLAYAKVPELFAKPGQPLDDMAELYDLMMEA